jgi:hypothetical protein
MVVNSISFRFFLVIREQLFQLRLLLGEQALFHCSLRRVGFGFQEVFEPVDVRLDDPAHRKPHRSDNAKFHYGRIEQP